jgi:hypothetical protein
LIPNKLNSERNALSGSIRLNESHRTVQRERLKMGFLLMKRYRRVNTKVQNPAPLCAPHDVSSQRAWRDTSIR